MLEEGVGDNRHERMSMQTLPSSALEVIETQLFFQLLVRLLANPSRFDGGRQSAQVVPRRQVGKIVFLLSRHPVFADEPSLLARQMLLPFVSDPLRRPIGNPHADRSKTSLELSFVPMRQLMVRHVAVASMSSAGIDKMSGTCRFRGRPRLATGKIIRTSAG